MAERFSKSIQEEYFNFGFKNVSPLGFMMEKFEKYTY